MVVDYFGRKKSKKKNEGHIIRARCRQRQEKAKSKPLAPTYNRGLDNHRSHIGGSLRFRRPGSRLHVSRAVRKERRSALTENRLH